MQAVEASYKDRSGAMSNKIVIIGCGNLNRSDDGVGVLVAHRLKQRLSVAPREDVVVFDTGTGGMDVMFQARGASALLIIDACCSGSEPGSVFRLSGEEVAARPAHGFSLHDFRWDHALYAGQKMFGDAFPREVTVYLVEAASTALGLEISASVSAAIDQVVAYVEEEVARLTKRDPHPAAGDIGAGSPPSCVQIRDGSLYMEAGLYSAFFSGLDSLVLLRQEEKMLMLPVRHAAAGGLLLKVRNSRGDRVVHAREFLTDQGLDEKQTWTLPVQWDSRAGALVADWPSGHGDSHA